MDNLVFHIFNKQTINKVSCGERASKPLYEMCSDTETLDRLERHDLVIIKVQLAEACFCGKTKKYLFGKLGESRSRH